MTFPAQSQTSPVPDLSKRLPPLGLPRRRSANTADSSAELAPATPSLLPPPTTFPPPQKLERRILSPADHELFLASPTYTLITAWIFTLSDAVCNTPISAVTPSAEQNEGHKTIAAILRILEQADRLIDACPAGDNGGSRFGNPVFKQYLDAVAATLDVWHEKELGIADAAVRREVGGYLEHSFGSKSRIDYGSGHELNFAMWLLCLYQLSLLPRADLQPIVLRVFPRYLRLMRRLQTTYYLEPAGSHGVWGLDDYQFLPFLFGASQLRNHPYITPKSIHRQLTLEECAKDYLYLDQVLFVNSVKNVEGLRWHSPMLDDISAAKSWAKIEGGMRKMFVKEVLGKLPVMQHFLFGSLIPGVEGMSHESEMAEEAEEDGEKQVWIMRDGQRHVHNPRSWADCCGIQVPSAVGAMQEMKKRMGSDRLRRIPFD